MPESILTRNGRTSVFRFIAALVCAIPLIALPAAAQRGGIGGPPPTVPRDAAPVDLTGYWVSIVTEDWIERMSPDSPPSGTGGGRGGFGGGGGGGAVAPSNPDDPCRVYGAAGSLRVPGRLNIAWVDDSTLQVEMDAGTQTRLFRFNAADPPPTESTLQGYSVARWETGGGGGRGRGRGAVAAPPAWGSLHVVTTGMTGGYLLTSRSNYSARAVLREQFVYHSDFGADYMTVVAIIEDGGSTGVTSSTFKKEADGSRFSPTACEVFL